MHDADGRSDSGPPSLDHPCNTGSELAWGAGLTMSILYVQ